MILCHAFTSLLWVPEGTLLHRLRDVLWVTTDQWTMHCFVHVNVRYPHKLADHVTYRATRSDYKETSRWQHDTCVLITEVLHTCAFLLHCMKLDSVWVIPVQSSHPKSIQLWKTFQNNCKETSLSIGFYQSKTCSATSVVWFITKWLFHRSRSFTEWTYWIRINMWLT